MVNSKQEYFNDNTYFLLEENGGNLILTYSVYSTLNESKNSTTKKIFDKSKEKQVKNLINQTLKSKTKISKKEIDKKISDLSKKKELDELVDGDGTMLSSKVPFLNMTLHPKKTMDQTVVATRISNDPVTRGYPVYYGESENKDGKLIDEVNFSDAFGYEETMDKDLKGTMKKLDDMGIDDPMIKLERAKSFGKRKDTKVVKNKKGEKVIKNLNLFEKQTLEEIKRQKMIKMVEDILAKKDKDDSDVMKKDNAMSRILTKNLESIKRLAEKEGISINKLINILKKGE
jgi:multimeric flavodoxin WrbA